jgi:putative heme-binding domain-containing protein
LLKTALRHPNRWHRETALRLLGDQKDAKRIPPLRELLRKETGQPALQAFWALNLCGGFGKEVALQALEHDNPHVRRWTVRLLGDQGEVSQDTAQALYELAGKEPDSETRSQLAATARRLPPKDGLPILEQLARRGEDKEDPHLSMMIWWGFEHHAKDHDAIIKHFEKPESWDGVLQADDAPPQQNLMRRWALSGEQIDLEACARLLELAPNPEQKNRLLKGFEKAFEGRSLPPFPESLNQALLKARGNENVLLSLRGRDEAAITKALDLLKDNRTPLDLRIQITRVLGDVKADTAVPVLIELVQSGKQKALRQEAMLSLQKFTNQEIGAKVIEAWSNLPNELQQPAIHLLSSRPAWALALVEACKSNAIPRKIIDQETLAKLRLHKSPNLKESIDKTFGSSLTRSETDLDRELARYRELASTGGGNPKVGESIYFGKAGCASCHVLFGKGGRIGPDLTPYDRSDLDAILLAIVRPNAEIREGYEHNLLTTKDGRILSGFKVEENPKVVILRGLDGQDHLVAREQIARFEPLKRSLMPDCLLSTLTPDELRNLFAYLASTTPPK